jgi:hypothetical protein
VSAFESFAVFSCAVFLNHLPIFRLSISFIELFLCGFLPPFALQLAHAALLVIVKVLQPLLDFQSMFIGRVILVACSVQCAICKINFRKNPFSPQRLVTAGLRQPCTWVIPALS